MDTSTAIAAVAKIRGYVGTYLAHDGPLNATQVAALATDLKTLDRDLAALSAGLDAGTVSSVASDFDATAKADALGNPGDVAAAADIIAAAFSEPSASIVERINAGKFPFWRLPLSNPLPVTKGALVGWLQGRGPADATAIEWSNRYPNATIPQLLEALSPVLGASGQNPFGVFVDEAGFEAHMAKVLGQ